MLDPAAKPQPPQKLTRAELEKRFAPPGNWHHVDLSRAHYDLVQENNELHQQLRVAKAELGLALRERDRAREAEQRTAANTEELVRAAVKAEREACAQVVEKGKWLAQIADAIRARGSTPAK